MITAKVLLTAFSLLAPVVQDGGDVAAAYEMADGGDLAGALELLRGPAAAGDVAAAVALSGLQVRAGDPEGALETLAALGQDDAYDVALAEARAHQALADKLHASGAGGDAVTAALQDAHAAAERAVDAAPDGNHEALCELGYIKLYRFGDHLAALELADAALAESADDGTLHLLRGCANVFVYWNAKNEGDDTVTQAAFDETIADLEKAAELLPRERVEPYSQLAWMYGDRGDAVKAVDAAIAIVDRQPEPNFDMLYNMAKTYSQRPYRFDASSKALEKMVNISAREITNRLRQEQDLGTVATEMSYSVGPFVQRQDQATARAILQAITAANPPAPVVWHNYAVMCEDTRRFEDALKAYERSIELSPDEARYYNDLGSLLHRQLNRDLDRAKELYETCIEKADQQLVAVNLPPERRAELTQARNFAQGGLDELTPASSGGGLLDGLLDGLSSLELPELPEDEEGGDDAPADDGGTDDGGTEDGGTDDGGTEG